MAEEPTPSRKDKRKPLKKKLSKTGSLPDTELKKLVIKMLTELRKSININVDHLTRNYNL